MHHKDGGKVWNTKLTTPCMHFNHTVNPQYLQVSIARIKLYVHLQNTNWKGICGKNKVDYLKQFV